MIIMVNKDTFIYIGIALLIVSIVSLALGLVINNPSITGNFLVTDFDTKEELTSSKQFIDSTPSQQKDMLQLFYEIKNYLITQEEYERQYEETQSCKRYNCKAFYCTRDGEDYVLKLFGTDFTDWYNNDETEMKKALGEVTCRNSEYLRKVEYVKDACDTITKDGVTYTKDFCNCGCEYIHPKSLKQYLTYQGVFDKVYGDNIDLVGVPREILAEIDTFFTI